MYKIIGGDGKEYGPVSAEQLRQWLNEGRVNANTRVLVEGTTEWKPLSAFPEFASAVTPPPAPATAPAFAADPRIGDASAAASRVKGPAIGLIVTAGLNLLFGVWGLLSRSASLEAYSQMPQFQSPQMKQWLEISSGPAGLAMALLQMLISVLILFGALRMLKLRSFGLAITASILALIPCITPCCGIITLPFGIWALVVLNKPEVKSQFS